MLPFVWKEMQLCAAMLTVVACVLTSTQNSARIVLVSNCCSSLLEFVTIRWRLLYLKEEFTTVFTVWVYSANAKEQLCELVICRMLTLMDCLLFPISLKSACTAKVQRPKLAWSIRTSRSSLTTGQLDLPDSDALLPDVQFGLRCKTTGWRGWPCLLQTTMCSV